MDEKEWQGYVLRVASCDYPIPYDFIKNYDDWHCRSIVGRMLLMLHEVESAMMVLSTVRDIEVDIDDNPEFGLSDPEHKCLCCRDLGEIVWLLAHNLEASLYYMNQAYDICLQYKHEFVTVKRGAIWVRRLELLREAGKLEEAVSECVAKLEEQNKEDKINQYLFYGHKFLAECFAQKENLAKACDLMAEAYKYFPLSEAGQRDIAEAGATEDLTDRYAKYMHCTTLQYLPWESKNTQTVEEVRRKQLERFLKKQQGDSGQQTNLSFNVDDYVSKK